MLLRIGRRIDNGLNDWVTVDPSMPHVAVILGVRGSGKTYTTSVFIEELLLSDLDVAVIVFDPVSVYFSLKEPNDWSDDMRTFGVEPLGFKDQVRIFVPGDAVEGFEENEYDGVLRFKPSSLSFDTWMDALKIDVKSPMAGLLERALTYLRGLGKDFTVEDVADVLDVPAVAKDFSYTKMSIGALRQRLYTANRMNLFSSEGFSISEIAKPRTCTVIDTSRSSELASRLVVSAICHEINEKRKNVVRKLRKGMEISKEEMVPPIWLIVEEAHNYIGRREVRHVEELIRYIRESRNYGCSLIAVSQQPSQLYTTAVSQQDILVIHNLVSDNDIKEALRIVPSEVRVSRDEIRMLKPGEAIFISGMDKNFMKIKVRPRMSRHVADTSILITPLGVGAMDLEDIRKSMEEIKNVLRDLTARVEEINLSLNHRINMLEQSLSDFVRRSELKDLLVNIVEEKDIDESNRVVFAARNIFDKICELCEWTPEMKDTIVNVLLMNDGSEIHAVDVLSGKYMFLGLSKLKEMGILIEKGKNIFKKDVKNFARKVLEKYLDKIDDKSITLFVTTLNRLLKLKFLLPEVSASLDQLEKSSD